VILFLHNRYRTTGGEERVVEDLMWLVGEHLGEPVRLLARESADLSRTSAAAGLLLGGSQPRHVARAVRQCGARVVHAHNLHPTFGWRALAAARAAGARVVLHLHQYRLVCAVGVCFTHGEPCTRCHGRNTLPGVVLNCRASRGEAVAYGAGLALWQRRLTAHADMVVVPSEFASVRLAELGARLPSERVRVLAPPLRALEAPAGESQAPGARRTGGYALVVSRLSREKGVDVAIDACRAASMPLVIAGEGPERVELEWRAAGAAVTFAGRVQDDELARLRAGAALALAPSRSDETFGLAAAEAMAAGVPVIASRMGALPELLGEEALVPAGDAGALAQAMARFAGDRAAGERARARVHALCAPQRVAQRLSRIYAETAQASA
jgi:glycosyltransferase involved in cell wall biosynthesis